ncbi:hypothetical protein Q5P01_004029 [Channa striata]|uniref:F-box domain-containing protein n=1 Tax=Channa striata TaxID=64152 RepID=A0AA88T1V6_CHASR|nr:hypothetical protein Q5P01_004029 [Channa striata]
MAASKAVMSRVRAARTSKRGDKSSPASGHNFMERLPSEILIKILSYLDASTLFTISYVNKLFNHLASDNALWNKIYVKKFCKSKKRKPRCVDDLLKKMAPVKEQQQAVGYWKWLFFKTVVACDMDMCKRHLDRISRHTGLPSRTERVLRNLRITWELTVTYKSGTYEQISTLQLHGVWRIALSCPGLKQPSRRSLMAMLDMQTLNEGAKVIGQDKLVELKLLHPGIVIGIWRGQCSVAFFIFTLHFHKLVERSIHGSSESSPYVEPIVNPPFDDIDPEYGLHGYQLHIVLHNTVCEFMSGSFSQLFCRRSQICDGHVPLTAISKTNLSQHTPLRGDMTLPWKCEALQGTVENCCIISLTLLDEFRNPFWCISSPVSVKFQKTSISYDYDGEHYLIHHQDSDGQVKMKLVWMKEQKQFVLVSLVVYVSIGKVNKYFIREY